MFKFVKKSCLDCSFCTRKRGYFYNTPLISQHSWRHDERTLNPDERVSFNNGNFSIIDKKIREYALWEIQYKKAEENYNIKKEELKNTTPNRVDIFTILENCSHIPFIGGFDSEKFKRYGVEPPPENVPEYDILTC